MKYDRALEEVWGWKEKAYNENKGKSLDEFVANIHKNAENFCKKHNFHLEKVNVEQTKHKASR